MDKFRIYLKKKKYVPKTIKRVQGIAKTYLNWLESKNLEIKETTYTDLLNFIGHMQNEKRRKSLINEYLRGLSHYYEYKKLPNITLEVRLLGETKTRLPLLKEEKLDELYDNFSPSEAEKSNQTDKIILGLIIYQALDRNEILKLRLDELNLAQGKIKIVGGIKKKTQRILNLESHQIIPLHEYINNHRLDINDKLFSFNCEKYSRLRNQLRRILVRIQSKNKEIINFNQIKQSRYGIWIQKYGIRKAQYLGGFKQPSSIQIYQNQDLEDLKENVLKFHPLNNNT